MSLVSDCSRCSALVKREGDHLCAKCAAELGRDARDPFWGAFPAHPDSKPPLTPEGQRARDFISVIDGLLSGKAA